MHAPAGLAELEAARRRLAFDELLALQLSLLLRRKLLQAPDGGPAEAHAIADASLADAGRAALPFALTAGQATALDFVLGQLRAPAPMMCLLQVRAPAGCVRRSAALEALYCPGINPGLAARARARAHGMPVACRLCASWSSLGSFHARASSLAVQCVHIGR